MAKKSTATLYQTLWNSADILRSKMDANEYKDYLLGLIFYKYLSDNLLYFATELLEEKADTLEEAQHTYEMAYKDQEIHEDLVTELNYAYSYILKPELTFTALMQDLDEGAFELDKLGQGFRDIEQSDELFENLFEDIDLHSRRLGPTLQKQSETIQQVMQELNKLDFADYDGDALGDGYEYLIGQFASESGKKAGEFYTPQAVSNLMTRIVMDGREDKRGFTAYDATMGSGSLLLNVKKISEEPQLVRFFGQEINTSTYNLARMNMILHEVGIENQNFNNGNTLEDDWPTEEPTNFDAVLMNPPYSAKWSRSQGFLDDARFAPYGVLPPKSRADYAFLLHGFYHLKTDGVMAIVLPHGILFRGGAEGTIRQALLENGSIDTVIGLPEKLFFNTGIPTTIVILKKDRQNRDVLFIDASNDFEKLSNQNKMTEEHVQKIFETYQNRETVDKYAYVASYEEIVENDFNLNIPRYVDTFEPEPEIPLADVSANLEETTKKLQETEKELMTMMNELVGTDEESDKELQTFISQLKKLGDFDE
ncbi:type I restriction-modification system subunit M [Carnobacteriaceae bacterium 52-44]